MSIANTSELNTYHRPEEKMLINHLKVISVWLILSILFFRFDELLITMVYSKYEWIRYITISSILIIAFLIIKSEKWYFFILLLIYPLILIFWTFPKNIFLKGKIYLLFEYINYIFGKIINWKKTLIEIALFILSFTIIIYDNTDFKYYLILLLLTYKYWPFLFRNIFKNFKKSKEIDNTTIETLEKYKANKSFEKSLAKSYIVQKEDDSLDISLRQEKKRTILTLYAITTFEEKIRDFKTTQAFTYLWIFKVIFIFLLSICYFWILNYTIFLIQPEAFIYNGEHPAFDFLYYTFKTITFGDINLVTPNSVISRSIEILSFLIFGIVILIYLFTFIISFKQESLKQKLYYSTEFCKVEKEIVENYLVQELKSDFVTGVQELTNIQDSMRKIKKIIDSIF